MTYDDNYKLNIPFITTGLEEIFANIILYHYFSSIDANKTTGQ